MRNRRCQDCQPGHIARVCEHTHLPAGGSQATVKSLDIDDLKGLGIKMVLCNAYHLYLRPA